jgi:hypothetical protein
VKGEDSKGLDYIEPGAPALNSKCPKLRRGLLRLLAILVILTVLAMLVTL